MALVTRRKMYNRPNVQYVKRKVVRRVPKNFKQLDAENSRANVNRAPIRNNMRNTQNSMLASALAAEYPLLPRRFAVSSEPIKLDPIFKHGQGSPEFLKECDAFLRANIKERRIGCPSGSEKPKAMVYQKTIAKLFDERTPVRRLLAVAQLGAGKTFMMLKILNNYINRPLAKILLFPARATVENFYTELLKFKNHHRTWLEQQLGRELSGKISPATMEQCKKLLRSPPPNTIAPLRCYRVTQFRTLMTDTSLFGKRKAYEPLWIVDEVHNLVAPSKKITDSAAMVSNLKKMRDYLRASKHRLVGFTATPIVDLPEQGQTLLDIVKGAHNASVGNHGFVSWYMQRSPTVFATADDFPTIVSVPVSGAPLIAAIDGKQQHRDKYLHTTFYHSGQEKILKQIVDAPEVYAPKLARIASDIAQHGKKTIVLIDKVQGLKALGEILRRRHKIRTLVFEGDQPLEGTKDYAAHKVRLDSFNSPENDHGELHQVAVCDAAAYSEGVSFQSVRVVVLAGIAEKYGLMLQRLGRALRSCSHERLPVSERHLEQLMYQIDLPKTFAIAGKKARATKKNPTPAIAPDVVRNVPFVSPDAQLYDKLMHDKPRVTRAMCQLSSYAVDQTYLGFDSNADCGGASPAVATQRKNNNGGRRRASPPPATPLHNNNRTRRATPRNNNQTGRTPPPLSRSTALAAVANAPPETAGWGVRRMLARVLPKYSSTFVPKHAPRAYANAQMFQRAARM